jgi:hypothetical protein
VKDAEKSFLAAPAKTAVEEPRQTYLDQGAIDAAKGAASAPRPVVPSLPLSFDLDNERVSIVLTPENFSDVLIGLYIAGEWSWVQSFLYAVGAALVGSFPMVSALPRPPGDPAEAARRQPFIDAAATALTALNDHIASALVALALQVTDKAQQLAVSTTASLDEQERMYGIRPRPPADVGQGGAEGGTGTNPGGGNSGTGGNSGAGGGTGTQATNATPQYESARPEIAADLVAAVEAVVTACATYKGLQQSYDKAKQEKATGASSGTGGSGGGPGGSGGQSGAEGGSGTNPAPDLKQVQSAQETVATTLRDAAAQHRLAPGVAALCLNEKKEGQPLGEQVVFAATVQYLVQARASLSQLPSSYDASGLEYAVRGALPRVLLDPQVRLEDRPEVRAAVFSGARVASDGGFQPLTSDLLLEQVRRDIVRAARGPAGDDEKVRAAFTLAVLNSYTAAADARDAIPAAKSKEEQAPLKTWSKITAALSLIGLFAAPVAVVAGGLGLVAMAGSAYLQFRSVAESNKVLDAAALDALLADDTAAFAQVVASKPRGIDVLTEAGASVGEMMLLDRVFPIAGLAVGAWSDIETLIED